MRNVYVQDVLKEVITFSTQTNQPWGICIPWEGENTEHAKLQHKYYQSAYNL